MKAFKYSVAAVLLITSALTLTLSSCQKDFDQSNYAPDRPIGGYASSKEIAKTNLVAYWAFDGSTTDSIGNLTGTATGTSFTTGKKGKALQGADNAYVVYNNAGSVIPALQSYTISFWMNTPKTNGTARGIFSLNNTKDFWGNLDIYLENYSSTDTAFFKLHMNNANVPWAGQFTDTKVPAAIGKWVHIAVTYDAGTSKYNVYANGKAIGVNTAGNTAGAVGPVLNGDDPAAHKTPYGPLKFVNANAMVFGTWQFQTNPSLTTSATAQTWAGSFQGALDEFRIYNKALPASDVSALFKLEGLGR